jgi:hypothetical protein
MKLVIRLEELAMWFACIVILFFSAAEWWWYLIMFIGPDVSMIGYLAGNKVGAWSYNLFHHKGVALLLILIWFILSLPHIAMETYNVRFLLPTGIALFGHSSMDRLFGYGLKYESGFKFTHLGEKPL